MSPSRTSFRRSLCSYSCCDEELSWACASSFLTSLPPYVLYTHPEALTRIRPLHVISCLPTTVLQQALVQKISGYVSGGKYYFLFPCMFLYIHRILPLLPSIFSHKMGNNSHSVCLDFSCCTFNLEPDFLFCSSFIQDCFKLLSISVLFHYIIQFF